MEVRIGVQNAAREMVLTSNVTAEDLAGQIAKALADGALLTLTDIRGRRVLVPADKIAFVELGPEEERRVGFGTA